MRQPLDGSHAIITGDNGAHRVSVIQWEISTIHLVRDQHFPLNRLFPGQTPGIRDWSGGDRLFCRGSPVGSLEDDLTSILFHAGPLQQGCQRHTGPFRIASGAELPLCPPYLRDKKYPTVTRALQSRDSLLGWHVSKLLVAQRKRILDGAIDAQLVRGKL